MADHGAATTDRGIVQELSSQFRSVFSGRAGLLDSVLPSVLFVIVNALAGYGYAVWSSFGLACAIAIWRLARRQPVKGALAGLGAVVVASGIAFFLDRAEGYYLPGIITGAATAVACLVSVLVKRPLVGWTSHIVRRWPRDWYWHPRVRPAYSEVTLAWAVFFLARISLQLVLLAAGDGALLGVVNLVAGWPATILLLAGSYLYGTRRLKKLGGPSVEEFRSGSSPPWQSQRHGF